VWVDSSNGGEVASDRATRCALLESAGVEFIAEDGAGAE